MDEGGDRDGWMDEEETEMGGWMKEETDGWMDEEETEMGGWMKRRQRWVDG